MERKGIPEPRGILPEVSEDKNNGNGIREGSSSLIISVNFDNRYRLYTWH